jgi:Asp-tRNA(Asn)/Glu-tRNA(Gln) amidotransferase A subunit family amidase
MLERGAYENEVIEAIRTGEAVPAKEGRQGYRKNFQYNQSWGDRTYAIKQVLAVVAENTDVLVVVTVYTFYF